jgi:hypothetical protein
MRRIAGRQWHDLAACVSDVNACPSSRAQHSLVLFAVALLKHRPELRLFGLRFFVLVGLLPAIFFTREPVAKLEKRLVSMSEALLEPHEAAELIALVRTVGACKGQRLHVTPSARGSPVD